MADTTPLLASLLMGQRQEYNPFAEQRKYGRGLIVQGSSTAPLASGNPLEGLARALQAGIGGLTAAYADKQEKDQQQGNIDIYSQAAAERDPQKAALLLKGLQGGGYQQEALLGQIIQNNINEGLKQQQAQGTYERSGAAAPPTQQPNAMPPQPSYAAGGTPTGLDNNVMNIRTSNASFADKGAPQNGFETFQTPQAGANATVDNFKAYVQQNPNITVAQAIAKWAPPSENNTNGYISRVAETSGINPGQPLAQVMQNPVDMARLMEAAIPVEKGKIPAGVTPDVLVNAGARGQQMAQAQPQGTPQSQQPAAIPPSQEAANFRAQEQQFAKQRDYVQANAYRQKAIEAEGKHAEIYGLPQYKQTLEQQQQTISNESKMRDDFRQEPVVKAYREVVPIMESVKQAVTRPTRAADLNLVYGLAKMMDPNSVVREGEMVMVRNTGTIGDYLAGQIGRLNGGQELQPETRAKIVEEMQSRFQGLQQSHDTVAEVYKGIAQRSGLNHENVVIPIRQGGVPQGAMPSPQGAAPAAGPIRIDINGKPL